MNGEVTDNYSVQASQSWVDKARHGVISSILYTQQGLQWTKNQVAGMNTAAHDQATGQYTAGSQQYHGGAANGTSAGVHAGQYTAPSYVPPDASNTAQYSAPAGSTAGNPAASSGINPAYNRVYNASSGGR